MEAVGPVGDGLENTVLISPDQQKINDVLEIETPSTKKGVPDDRRLCCSTQEILPGYATPVPGHNASVQCKCEVSMELRVIKGARRSQDLPQESHQTFADRHIKEFNLSD